MFPITFMKSVYEATVIESELAFIKRMQKILTLFGTSTLLLALWLLFALMPVLQYNPEIIIARDALFYFMMTCTVLGLIGITSTFFVSLPQPAVRVIRRVSLVPLETVGAIHQKYNLQEKHLKVAAVTAIHFTNFPLENAVKAKQGVSLFVRAALIILVVLVTCAPYVLPRSWNKIDVRLASCGERLTKGDDPVEMYHLGNKGMDESGVLKACKGVRTGVRESLGKNFELLACIELANSTKMLLLDKAFSTRVPHTLDYDEVLLVRPQTERYSILEWGLKVMAKCAGDPDLVVAAREGNLDKVKRLLEEEGVAIDQAVDNNGITALAAAAEVCLKS